jgi:hypothetical protein
MPPLPAGVGCGVLHLSLRQRRWRLSFMAESHRAMQNLGLALVGFVPVKTPAVAVAASREKLEFFDPLLGIIREVQTVA